MLVGTAQEWPRLQYLHAVYLSTCMPLRGLKLLLPTLEIQRVAFGTRRFASFHGSDEDGPHEQYLSRLSNLYEL